MHEHLDDPSTLTKERLKSALRAHNVELPGGNPNKDVYVQLYVKTVCAQSHGYEAVDAFSSDEDLPPLAHSRRSRSSGGKKSQTQALDLDRQDMAVMSDEDLRDELLRHGVHAGPIVASTRKLYENKLQKLLDNGAILSESESHSHREGTEVYSDQEDEVHAAPEPEVHAAPEPEVHAAPEPEPTADAPLVLEPVTSSSSLPPSAQRESHSQHSVTTMEKMREAPPTELKTFTGLMATCRHPIKGAAGRWVKGDLTQGFESKSSICHSDPTLAFSTPIAPFPTKSVASSTLSGASPSAARQAKAHGMLWWKKLLLLAILVLFAFVVYQATQSNTGAPVQIADEL